MAEQVLQHSGLAIPVFYLPAFFYNGATNFAIVDHWRFWIIHLWVEDFFELFVTVVVAVLFYRLGAVTVVTAKRVIYLYRLSETLASARHRAAEFDQNRYWVLAKVLALGPDPTS